jgi:hypothetical protein
VCRNASLISLELRFRLEDDPSTEILVDFSEYGNPPLSAVLKSKFPSVDFELVGIVLNKQLFHPQNYVCHILNEHEKAPEAVADIRQGTQRKFYAY